MSEKMMETLIAIVEKGGTEGASLIKLYIWLNSTLMRGVVLVLVFAMLGLMIPWLLRAIKKVMED